MKTAQTLMVVCIFLLSFGAIGAESAWWNFTTQKYDYIEGAPSEQEITDYLPQADAAKGLYSVYRKQGIDYLEAYVKVLRVSLQMN